MKGGENMQKLTMYRLIADEGKVVTNGEITGKVIDAAPNVDPFSFYEIDEQDAKEEESK